LKRFIRYNCRYLWFPELEPTVLQSMDSVDLRTIRRFAMRSKRWLLSYINGLTEGQRSFTEREYKSHRRLTSP
jgi:hypothetical protein